MAGLLPEVTDDKLDELDKEVEKLSKEENEEQLKKLEKKLKEDLLKDRPRVEMPKRDQKEADEKFNEMFPSNAEALQQKATKNRNYSSDKIDSMRHIELNISRNNNKVHNTKVLAGEIEPTKFDAWQDLAVDLGPSIISAILGKSLSSSKLNKDYHIQSADKNIAYNVTQGPSVKSSTIKFKPTERLQQHWVGGDQGFFTSGPLSRLYYKFVDGPATKHYEKKMGKIISKAKHPNESFEDAAIRVSNYIKNGLKDSNGKSFGAEIDDLIKTATTEYINESDTKLITDAVTKLKLNDDNIPIKNIIAHKAPPVLYTYATINAANSIYNYNKSKIPLPDRGNLESTGLPTISELLDEITEETWRYDSLELMKQINRYYDGLSESNLRPDDMNEINKIYSNIDFDNKKSMLKGLKVLVKWYNTERY